MLFRSIPSANVIRFPCCRGGSEITTLLFSPKKRMTMSMMMPQFVCFSSSKRNKTVYEPKLYLLVGLGNPGEMYQGTRHNVGFAMIDALAQAEGIQVGTVGFNSLFGRGKIGNVPVILAKPQTTVNFSGESVHSIVSHYKIPLEKVVVVYDDFDLPLATLCLEQRGGHGGHNGMRSIIKHLGNSFPRLRIGIGAPPSGMFIGDFVLGHFDKEEHKELGSTFQHGVDALRILVLMGFAHSLLTLKSSTTLEGFDKRLRGLINSRIRNLVKANQSKLKKSKVFFNPC